jgi:hypothetical protein
MTAMFGESDHRVAVGNGGLIALVLVSGITLAVAAEPSALTRSTIHLALIEDAFALWLMVGMNSEGWQALTSRGRLARWLWTWACLTFLVHVACAFHFSHRWSHRHAFEQTRLESGFGEGLYVNYLFMAVWIADVLWWWIAPAAYARRMPWIDRLLHGFLLLIAFNATVVFESGAVRSAGAVGSLLLAARWIRRSTRKRIVDSAQITPAADSE